MKKKSHTYPLAIRITYNRISVLFSIGLEVTLEDFGKLGSPRLGPALAQIRDTWVEKEERAKKIIKTLGTFTFPAFREAFYKDDPTRRRKGKDNSKKTNLPPVGGESAENTTASVVCEGKNKKYGKRKYDRIRSTVNFKPMGPLAELYGDYISVLEGQGRIGTSEAYFSALQSLLKFKPFLRVEDISVGFLHAFENWFLGTGGSETTVGIYLRTLRCILNIQKSEGLLPEREYPFGSRKYQIPAGANVKIALDFDEIKALWNYQYQTTDEKELYYLAIWFFGFFANGINPKDIIHLRYSNFYGDFIIIHRQKTRRTARGAPKAITIPILEPMRRIIQRFGNRDTQPENYVFNVLRPGLSPHRQRELGQEFTCTINDWMNKIAITLNINKRITTKVYRHSFATILKRSGISTEFIMEALGHHNLATTESYLADFELEVKKKVAEKLAAFIELPTNAKFPGI